MFEKLNKNSSKYGVGYISLLLVAWLLKILSYALGVYLGIIFVSAVTPYFDGSSEYKILVLFEKIGGLSKTFLSQHTPTRISGYDITNVMLIVGSLILKSSLSRSSEKIKEKIYLDRFKKNYKTWKERQNIKFGSGIVKELDKKLYDLEHAKPRDREDILKQFIETKKKLDVMGRDIAFLSMDIVDSTKMKEGEEKAFVEYDFREFKKFVSGTLATNNSLKSVWTPDGVMCAFYRVDEAVAAARQVIDGLESFNKNVKTIKMEFNIRCGINSGFVYYDDNLPLEEIADRVIDVAGHIQKKALPNTICIAKPSIEPLTIREGFIPTENVIDGYQVYEWKKNSKKLQ